MPLRQPSCPFPSPHLRRLIVAQQIEISPGMRWHISEHWRVVVCCHFPGYCIQLYTAWIWARMARWKCLGSTTRYLMKIVWTYLIIMGKIQRSHVSSTGGLRILFPGLSIHKDCQTSPKTFAKEVPISAKITSEKYIGPYGAGKRHLLIALKRSPWVWRNRFGMHSLTGWTLLARFLTECHVATRERWQWRVLLWLVCIRRSQRETGRHVSIVWRKTMTGSKTRNMK